MGYDRVQAKRETFGHEHLARPVQLPWTACFFCERSVGCSSKTFEVE
jgi:hypothetical protein